MQVRRTLMFFATGALLIVAGIAGGGAATAAGPTATLSIPYVDCEANNQHYDYIMRVAGDAADYSAYVRVTLYGDDSWSDDKLADYVVSYNAAPGHYQYQLCVNTSTLNEDWGNDEVYARVDFVDHAGHVRRVETNVIKGDF